MRADNDNAPRLLTKKAAAAYVGVSTTTFSKWVSDGKLPHSFEDTGMWNKLAIGAALDKRSEADADVADDAFDKWKRAHAEKFARHR
jgi:predicted DNA-binding transcriptional regulator AlpA